MRSACPRHLSLLLALVATGCGSADSATEPPPDHPVPASLTLEAGDDQEAAPGESVPIAPAVRVRDAAGRPVPDVAVTFSVDSGGGVIEGGSPHTGSDGIARAGLWRLGPDEGRQDASAHAAGLPAVRFTAYSVGPTTTFPSEDVDSAGGTLRLSESGNPLDGSTIEVPAGALGGTTTFSLQTHSAARVVLPAGISAAGPVLSIAASNGALREPLILRLRLPEAPPQHRVVLVRRGSSSWRYPPSRRTLRASPWRSGI